MGRRKIKFINRNEEDDKKNLIKEIDTEQKQR